MTSEQLFLAANLAVLPFWLLMAVAPRWRFTRLLMGSLWVPAAFAALYAVLVVPHLPAALQAMLRPPDLDATAELLGRRDVTVVAWVHYIVFDLFVGRWEYLDGQERGLHPLLAAPPLLLTLFFGPLGFLLHLLCRQFGRREAGSPSA